MAIYFHRVTALGLPVNLLVVPLIGLALPSALLTFATLLVRPSLAIVPGTVTAALLHAINGIVRLFSGMAAGDIRNLRSRRPGHRCRHSAHRPGGLGSAQ